MLSKLHNNTSKYKVNRRETLDDDLVGTGEEGGIKGCIYRGKGVYKDVNGARI